ncbi:MAG: hypothetical protein WD096_11840 [Actinomycetota bacterium]
MLAGSGRRDRRLVGFVGVLFFVPVAGLVTGSFWQTSRTFGRILERR